MKERIRISLCFIGILSAIFAVYFTAMVFERGMDEQLRQALRESAHLIESSYQKLDGPGELQNFASDSLRITLIQGDGTVLFESDEAIESMGNHKNRPEIAEAFEKGTGENLRYSVTLNTSIYYYAVRLDNGCVLRLGMRQANLQRLFSEATPYLLILIAAIIVASIVVAIILSRLFVRPIQKISDQLEDTSFLDDEDVNYKEMAPFIKKIRKQRRELELTIEQLKTEKSKTAKMKDEFTANASHELKTPLTSISGYAEMIANGMAKPEDVIRFASKIHKESDRLLAIANDIMTLAKLDEPGDTSPNLSESVDLYEIVESCVGDLTSAAEKKHIALTVAGKGNSPILGNNRLLYELFYNLVDNAIRYTPDRSTVQDDTSPAGNIRDSKKISESRIEITVYKDSVTVKDNGIGIPDDSRTRVFERFYRVDKSRSKATGGTGLGLAIVKHIADLHNAKIHLESALGVGTEIRVEFS
ncbi:MAG: histidine kinase [Fibrobacter sp.]|nr:histidine kinase [Fibrobacter sp.]